MVDERSKRIQADEEALERAAEPHDWFEEIIDGAVGGLVSPLTRERVHEEDAPIEPEKKAADEARDQREADERLNEVW